MNGYKNWETWNLILWLDSNENACYKARRAARRGPEAMRDMVECENQLNNSPSWYSDVIQLAISEVAWDEVISFFLDEGA